MTIAIIGASGFVGQHLIAKLLAETDYNLLAISRHPEQLARQYQQERRLTCVAADILDQSAIRSALKSAEIAFYLVHSLSKNNNNLWQADSDAAQAFCQAMSDSLLTRVIYLGGLGSGRQQLSAHLKSRQNVGHILRQHFNLVIEFRASIIIGNGSVSFEVIKRLVNRLSFMILPSWANTLVQPIGIDDVVSYLMAAIETSFLDHAIFEIGNPEVMTYKALMLRYAQYVHRHLTIVVIPFLPNWPGTRWLQLLIPNQLFSTVKLMVGSLPNQVVVTNNHAAIIFHEIKPALIEVAFRDNQTNYFRSM